jgi:hypothetical protein
MEFVASDSDGNVRKIDVNELDNPGGANLSTWTGASSGLLDDSDLQQIASVIQRSEFTMTRKQATRRVAQGITLADFLQAFRIGQLTLWHGVLAAAGDDPAAREAALAAVTRIMTVIEVGNTVAAEAYVEAQQHAVAETDRVRRDLLEDLLARRTSFTGAKRAILRAAGLGPDSRLLVACAVLAGDQSDDHALQDAALAVGRARGTGGRALVVVRQDEIVLVAPVPRGGAEPAVAGLRRVCAELRQRQIALGAGVSTLRAGPAGANFMTTSRPGLWSGH